MKRSKAEWGFDEILDNKPDGVETKPIQLDADTFMLVVKYPSSVSDKQQDGILKWGQRLKKMLPENAFLLLVDNKMDIEVQRPPIPRTVEMRLNNCKITGDGYVWEKLLKEIENLDQAQDLAYVQIVCNDCEFDLQGKESTTSLRSPMVTRKQKKEVKELQKALSTIKPNYPTLNKTEGEETPLALDRTMGRPPDPPALIDNEQIGEELTKVISGSDALKEMQEDLEFVRKVKKELGERDEGQTK